MNSSHARVSTIAVIVLLFAGVTMPLGLYGQPGTSVLGPSGTVWGGQHVELQVTPEGATLELDCATGTITQTLEPDAQGNFKITGTFMREHPGPVMRDGPPPASATYSGSIHNGTMKLTITSGPENESQGEYMLAQGKPGRVLKCR